MNETDRLARAGNYVFGLMDEAERERAERDLERDTSFRDAVMEIAERQRLAKLRETPETNGRWQAVSAHLAGLPQMQSLQNEIKPAAPSPAASDNPSLETSRFDRPMALRLAMLATLVLTAFVLGYVMGAAR
jgi:anti-sigma-K factor RskA